MNLSSIESKNYIEAHLDFLYYVGKRTGILKNSMNFTAFQNLGLKVKFQCRDRFLKNPKLLDDYLTLYFNDLEPEKIKILEGFRKRISGDFVILKYLKNHAVFIDLITSKIYLVKALKDRFDQLIPGTPKMVKATILPFMDKIIYDGFLEPYTIIIGKGIKNDLSHLYKKAKEKKELISEIK